MPTTKRSPFPEQNTSTDSDSQFVPPNLMEFLALSAEDFNLNVQPEEPELQDISLQAVGGTGEIYTARDESLGRTVALKILNDRYRYDEEQMERLVREAKAAAQLEHPNIVPIHSIGISPSKGIYFTMKRLRGDSLRHIITQLEEQNPAYTRVYTSAVRLNIFIKICQGIGYAHSKNIIHRDLKPENILIGNYGEVTIIDWGLVKKMDHSVHAPKRLRPSENDDEINDSTPASAKSIQELERDNFQLPEYNPTCYGDIHGTPRFMSPEQIRGDISEIDTRTDIYALGIILYELLTLTNPFNHLSKEDDILSAVSRGIYTKPRQTVFGRTTPPELQAICLKAMNVNRENRYQSVGELIQDVLAHMEERSVSAYNAPPIVRLRKLCRRNPIKTSIFLSFIFAIISFIAANRLLQLMRDSNTYLRAQQDIRMATQKLHFLEAHLTQQEDESADGIRRLSADQMQTNLDSVDNLIISANQLLSSIHSRKYTKPSHTIRDQMFMLRIRYSLAHGTRTEQLKLKGLLQTYFGQHFRNCTPIMKSLIGRLNSAIEGQCTLSVLSAMDNVSFTISPIHESSKTGRRTVSSPLSLKTNTLPANALSLSKGSYQITFSSKNRPNISLFFTLGHGENAFIKTNLPEHCPEGTVFIPEGKCPLPHNVSPQDIDAIKAMPTTQKSFFIATHEVTNREYLEFWNELDNYELKQSFRSCVWLTPDAAFAVDAWDDNGNLKSFIRNGREMLSLDAPVVGISQAAAAAFCKWKGEKLNCICRLPTSNEWLRAATGDDGRMYPWGNIFQNEFAATRESKRATSEFGLIPPPEAFPEDLSPYGVFDMAGNAREWTSTPSAGAQSNGLYQIKGASVATTRKCLPLGNSSDFMTIPSDVGFRYVIEFQNP